MRSESLQELLDRKSTPLAPIGGPGTPAKIVSVPESVTVVESWFSFFFTQFDRCGKNGGSEGSFCVGMRAPESAEPMQIIDCKPVSIGRFFPGFVPRRCFFSLERPPNRRAAGKNPQICVPLLWNAPSPLFPLTHTVNKISPIFGTDFRERNFIFDFDPLRTF